MNSSNTHAMELKLFINMPLITFFCRNNILYCRVRLNETVTEFSTKEKIEAKYWDQKAQKYKSKKAEQNNFIDSLLTSITYKVKSKAVLIPDVTAKELVQEFFKKKQEISIVDLCKQYINSCDAEAGTIKNHEIKIQNLIAFQQFLDKKLSPENFTLKTACRFIEWFLEEKETKNVTTANRNVAFYRMVLLWYRKKGNKITSELFDFRAEKDKLKVPVVLTVEEIAALQNTVFMSGFLNRIKDLFIFQCYTGLSYCDLWNEWELKKEDFGTILTGKRGKNGQGFWLPVEKKEVLTILEKYNFKLPRYENIVYNRILKEIAALTNINKRITTHTARKTFATLMDAEGWSRESVSKMLGHKSYRTTELYYLGESFARIENELKQRQRAV